jgi:hypothetical protein
MAEIAWPTVQTLGIALLLISDSTTDPFQHRNGSVIESEINKSAIPRVHTVGQAISAIF